MAQLKTDDIGRPIPQYQLPDASNYEAWQGKNGAGKMYADDGAIETLGKTTDTSAQNTLIGLFKKFISILPSALSAGGNLKTAVVEPLPAGTNKIGVADVNVLPSSTVFAGTVTTTTTAVAIATQSCQEVFLQADPANTYDVYVGNSAVQPIKLKPGATISLPVTNVNALYHKTITSTATLNWLARN